jgi:hypothetical protein
MTSPTPPEVSAIAAALAEELEGLLWPTVNPEMWPGGSPELYAALVWPIRAHIATLEARLAEVQGHASELADLLDAAKFERDRAERNLQQNEARLGEAGRDAERLDFLDTVSIVVHVRNGRRYEAGPGGARTIIEMANAYHTALKDTHER